MKFRFRALLVHLLSSAGVLALIVGSLYAGWYHWPGCYLANASQVAGVMVGVDVGLGTGRLHPLLAVFDPSSLKLVALFKFD
jgi:hypothetical protein